MQRDHKQFHVGWYTMVLNGKGRWSRVQKVVPRKFPASLPFFLCAPFDSIQNAALGCTVVPNRIEC